MSLPHLKEYVRVWLAAQLKSSPETVKRLEYLRFLGAHLCPACKAELDLRHLHQVGEIQHIDFINCHSCGAQHILEEKTLN